MSSRGWITHCKTAFFIEAKERYYKRSNIELTLRQMAIESKIPIAVLGRWWAETKHNIEIDICKNCKKNNVEVKRGKPLSKRSIYHGLCISCRKKVAAASKKGEKNGKKY